MVPKLKEFDMKFLLPELVFPRYGTISGIRQPLSPWYTGIPPITIKEKQKITPDQETSIPPNLDRPSSPVPSTSQVPDIPLQSTSRSRRTTTTKFIGRRILHEWQIDENTSETKWYTGIVTDVVRGRDGHPGAIYNVYYKEDDTSYEIEDLLTDYLKGSVKFKDL